MRKYLYMISVAVLLMTGSSCDKLMDTSPTADLGSNQVFASASSSLTAINGIYRAMYVAEWGPAWEHENGGIMAYILASDLMGEDHIMNAMGSGWFFYDHVYGIGGDYTKAESRQGQCWNFFYTLINNANNIIAQEENIQDDPNLASYVVGQAYAVRAFSYLWLVQNYQQSDPSLPGVPVYTEPTTITSKGKGRGTVQDVYDRINEDLEDAIEKLSQSSVAKQHPSHIDLGAAYGLQARALLAQKDYAGAETAALNALDATSAAVVPFNQTAKVNDVSAKNVMWGLAIQTDQSPANAGIYAHLDADSGGTYSEGVQHEISAWLYDNLPETDARKAWWTAPLPEKDWVINSSQRSYVQVKFVYKDASLGTGDYILMRAEEMALIAAEAACHQKKFTEAKTYVSMVTKERDTDYQANLAKYTESEIYAQETSAGLVTLMDYILYQRRVELWGEVSRIHDLKRLGLGVNRDYAHPTNNHIDKSIYEAGDPFTIYSIPLFEFDGNDALDIAKDQNPFE